MKLFYSQDFQGHVSHFWMFFLQVLLNPVNLISIVMCSSEDTTPPNSYLSSKTIHNLFSVLDEKYLQLLLVLDSLDLGQHQFEVLPA